ncbi:uncharacterized protein LOC111371935 [Olea europaea var. sylvestris]|uniref:uncharacterized protein LOC111371935 n=1 Tax=Olea europaea var. sylvestris TaxID=158386 RepID=UPI000C1CF787|nr:uncharacterized protein LOC111371935 [Olea europaea var. sylvestris]
MDMQRRGKALIRSWKWMKQLMMSRFLPPDYEQFTFQSLQNCVQGNRSVVDYTEEWSRLSVRNNLSESEVKQVSRYLGGLKPSIRDKIGLYVVWTVDEAHNLALKVELMEKTFARSSNYKKDMCESSYTMANRGRFTPGEVHTPSKSVADQAQRSVIPNNNHAGTRPATLAKEAPRAPNSYTKPAGFKCYRCGQLGHRSNECPAKRSVNFVDAGEDGEEEQYVEEGAKVEELLDGAKIVEEQGEFVNCVVKHVMCSTKVEESLQRNNIFKVEKHLKPYVIGWIQKGPKVSVTEVCKVPISIGQHYQDEVVCDVVDTDASHVLLGHPWQFKVDVAYREHDNVYVFNWKGKKIAMVPKRNPTVPTMVTKEGQPLLSLVTSVADFESEVKEAQEVHVVVVRALMIEEKNQSEVVIPGAVQSLLDEFSELVSDELPDDLPPLRDIQHSIDLVPGASLPNMPHYRMSSKENQILQEKVEELLKKGFIRESMNPCAVPTLLVPKKAAVGGCTLIVALLIKSLFDIASQF